MHDDNSDDSFLDKLAPEPLKKFDAFPKLPSTYQSRSDGRGFLTVLIGLLCFTLILTDIGEFIWGWPDYQFGMDREVSSFMPINLDMVVNMPCRFLSIDLRDSTGDRLHLSGGFARDGTTLDEAQARKLQQYAWAQTTSQRKAIPQTRSNRGFFSTLFRKTTRPIKPNYTHKAEDTACRIHGTVEVKKVTANLHITTLGHGYASPIHVSHEFMNLTHFISEFSFGPYIPNIVQPLDNTYVMTKQPFTAYQYFLTVVPTKYIPPRSAPIRTHQYSVTNYNRVLEHNQGTPGIFFKFDLDPIAITIHERTTTFAQFMIRVVGVVGGVWCCMGWAVRVSYKAVEVVTGVKEGEQEIVAVETSGAKRRTWGGGELTKRRVVKQGNGWVVEGANDWNGAGGGGYYSPQASPGYGSVEGGSRPGSTYFPSPRASQQSFPSTSPPQNYAAGMAPSSPGVPTFSSAGGGPPQHVRTMSQADRALKDK